VFTGIFRGFVGELEEGRQRAARTCIYLYRYLGSWKYYVLKTAQQRCSENAGGLKSENALAVSARVTLKKKGDSELRGFARLRCAYIISTF
jgi:hypothetical protein